MADAPLLAVEGLGVAYAVPPRPAEVVTDVSFTIHDGEVFALAGESGSGKSTVAQAILRLLRPPAVITAGRVLFQGRDVLEMASAELARVRWKEIAIVFQSAMNTLNPVIAVGMQIADVLVTRAGLPRRAARRRAIELLAELHLEEATFDAYAHELSGGMRQRAVLAIALALQPKLLILDEPTTALDVLVQREIIDLLARLREKAGFAALFISHDLALLGEVADRIGIMLEGRVVEAGTTADVLHAPQHPYSQKLVAAFREKR